MRQFVAVLLGMSLGLLVVQVFHTPPRHESQLLRAPPRRKWQNITNDAVVYGSVAQEPLPRPPRTTALPGKPLQRRTALPLETTSSQRSSPSPLSRTALVILAHDRVDSLRACVAGVVALKEFSELGAFEVSADAPMSFEAMERVSGPATFRKHAHVPDRRRGPRGFRSTALAKISEHVFAAVDGAFRENAEMDLAIVLEDDLRVAADFLTLFAVAAPSLEKEKDAWCVSAWNDNAADSLADWRPSEIGRTHFFPGLGWMVSRRTWTRDLAPHWPAAPTTGWDHWIRTGSKVRQRYCFFPEVPRVRHAQTARSSNVLPAEAKRLERFAFYHGGATTSPLRPPLPTDLYDKTFKDLLGSSSTTAVVLATFPEDLPKLAKDFALWPSELRGYYKGLVLLRRRQGRVVLVVDRRTCTFLPETQRLTLPDNARIVAANAANQDCHETCRSQNLKCEDHLLRFISADCDALQKAFPCEHGCGHQLGTELPAYVTSPQEATFGQCLMTNHAKPSTCDAKHQATVRLCPCIPVTSRPPQQQPPRIPVTSRPPQQQPPPRVRRHTTNY